MFSLAQRMEDGSVTLCLGVTIVHMDGNWFNAYILSITRVHVGKILYHWRLATKIPLYAITLRPPLCPTTLSDTFLFHGQHDKGGLMFSVHGERSLPL